MNTVIIVCRKFKEDLLLTLNLYLISSPSKTLFESSLAKVDMMGGCLGISATVHDIFFFFFSFICNICKGNPSYHVHVLSYLCHIFQQWIPQA